MANPAEEFDKVAQESRLWMLIPKGEGYSAGFQGNFYEAMAKAVMSAATFKTAYLIFEANPEHYRRQGGLKEHWATVQVPKESPIRTYF